ncbi:putative dsRNA-binding protein [Streptomyces bullii]
MPRLLPCGSWPTPARSRPWSTNWPPNSAPPTSSACRNWIAKRASLLPAHAGPAGWLSRKRRASPLVSLDQVPQQHEWRSANRGVTQELSGGRNPVSIVYEYAQAGHITRPDFRVTQHASASFTVTVTCTHDNRQLTGTGTGSSKAIARTQAADDLMRALHQTLDADHDAPRPTGARRRRRAGPRGGAPARVRDHAHRGTPPRRSRQPPRNCLPHATSSSGSSPTERP